MDVKCENILELSFDSELMEDKEGVRYPNFYVVLNHGTEGEINQQQ